MIDRLVIAAVAASPLLLFPADAQALAYIDPGTGSLLLQALAAGILGAMLTFKIWYRAARVQMARLFRRGGSDEGGAPAGEVGEPGGTEAVDGTVGSGGIRSP